MRANGPCSSDSRRGMSRFMVVELQQEAPQGAERRRCYKRRGPSPRGRKRYFRNGSSEVSGSCAIRTNVGRRPVCVAATMARLSRQQRTTTVPSNVRDLADGDWRRDRRCCCHCWPIRGPRGGKPVGKIRSPRDPARGTAGSGAASTQCARPRVRRLRHLLFVCSDGPVCERCVDGEDKVRTGCRYGDERDDGLTGRCGVRVGHALRRRRTEFLIRSLNVTAVRRADTR